MNTQKNYTLELLKLFASYMVVFIHIMFYGEIGIIMDTLARFAVPLFFLISGYYSFRIKPEKIKKRIRHILGLIIFSTVCYTLYNIVILLSKGTVDGIVSYFEQFLNIGTLIKIFIFNVPVSSVHLWFLLALVYTYFAFYFATVFRFNEKAMFIISFLLLFLHILLGECLSSVGIVIPIPIVRNFALMGIPFFALGLFTKKHENKLRSIPNYALIIAVAIGIFESLFSRCFFGKNELYVGSLLILFAIVVVFIKYPTVKYPLFFNALSGCSTYVYIFHIMISSVILQIYKLFTIDFNTSIILKYAHPIIVCFASTIFAYGIIQLLNILSSVKCSFIKKQK